ncbi:hypothetical protein QTP88_015132 [Uroleucon formosanum]
MDISNRALRWREYFENLLNSTIPDSPISATAYQGAELFIKNITQEECLRNSQEVNSDSGLQLLGFADDLDIILNSLTDITIASKELEKAAEKFSGVAINKNEKSVSQPSVVSQSKLNEKLWKNHFVNHIQGISDRLIWNDVQGVGRLYKFYNTLLRHLLITMLIVFCFITCQNIFISFIFFLLMGECNILDLRPSFPLPPVISLQNGELSDTSDHNSSGVGSHVNYVTVHDLRVDLNVSKIQVTRRHIYKRKTEEVLGISEKPLPLDFIFYILEHDRGEILH